MLDRWSAIASLRRSQIENGLDVTFSEVFVPIFVGLVKKLSPITALEIGAGTGHLAKLISDLGVAVTAVEPSNGMYAVASKIVEKSSVNLFNCRADELNIGAAFDFVYSHMVAHAVDDLHLYYSAAEKHLTKQGLFYFSLPHPCFFNDYKKLIGDDYEYMRSSRNLTEFSISGDLENKIIGVPYNHRPLSEYINQLGDAGLRIESFKEIYPALDIQKKYREPWRFPRYCIFACRKL